MQVLEVRHKVSLLIWILIRKDLSQTIKRLAPSSETNSQWSDWTSDESEIDVCNIR